MSDERKIQIKKYAFLIAAAIVGFILVLICTSKYGPGVTHDSVAYIYAADSLSHGNGYEYFGYVSPFIQWPPLFPTLLAGTDLLGINAVDASRFINALGFAAIIFLCGKWFFERLKNPLVALLGTLAVLFAPPLLSMSINVWTETLFVLFFVAFLITFDKYIRTDRKRWLVWASVFTALACLERYMGVTIVAIACLALLLQKKSFKTRVINIFTFGLISCVPTLIWVIRNYIESSTLVGVRPPALVTLAHNIKLTAKTLASWVLPYNNLGDVLPSAGQKLVLVLSILTVVAIAVLIVVAVCFVFKKNGRDGLIKSTINKRTILVLTGFIIIYTIYMIISATKVAFDPIGDRYMIPVYIPLILLAILLIDNAISIFKSIGTRKLIPVAMVLLTAVWLLYPALRTAEVVKMTTEYGTGGYASTEWKNNNLIKYLRGSAPDGAVFTNDAAAVNTAGGIDAKYTPRKNGPEIYGVEKFKKLVESSKTSYLVWFSTVENDSIYGPEDIGKLYKVEKITSMEEGSVYKITK